MMTDEIDWERLARYTAGEATAAERAEVERWAAGSAERAALLESLAARWDGARSPSRVDVDAAWGRLSAKLREDRATPAAGVPVIDIGSRRAARPDRFATRFLPIAATIVIAVGIGVFWRQSSITSDSTSPTLASAAAEFRTGIGERRTVDLPDGTQVVLGAASTLRLSASFGQERREVALEGQARFRVVHDSLRPFLVHAAGTVSEDLGTEFDVRAYPGDGEVRVVVSEGIVGVRREQATENAALLRPRDVARVDSSGTAVVLRDQAIERFLSWTNGELAFDDALLPTVCEELERWYDIECRIAGSDVAGLHYTGSFKAEALDVVLEVIEASLPGARAERTGRVVTFTAGSGVGRMPAGPARPYRVEAGA